MYLFEQKLKIRKCNNNELAICVTSDVERANEIDAPLMSP